MSFRLWISCCSSKKKQCICLLKPKGPLGIFMHICIKGDFNDAIFNRHRVFNLVQCMTCYYRSSRSSVWYWIKDTGGTGLPSPPAATLATTWEGLALPAATPFLCAWSGLCSAAALSLHGQVPGQARAPRCPPEPPGAPGSPAGLSLSLAASGKAHPVCIASQRPRVALAPATNSDRPPSGSQSPPRSYLLISLSFSPREGLYSLKLQLSMYGWPY